MASTVLEGRNLTTPDSLPMLDDLQAGHLRHFDNISRLPVNVWTHMNGRAPMQEDYGAYRYQLAYMAYAAALAHYHRLPAAPAAFHGTFTRLIEKMLLPEVWLYWRNASIGGGPFALDLPLLESRIDPVAEDNIMYSAYLQTMTLMNTMLFGDRRYEAPDSIEFNFDPKLWGKHLAARFTYDQRSLNDKIYWNMVANGYLGVACEPYCVFQICNQIPILGFRLHDHLYGGSLASEVTEGYLKAWGEFGGLLDEAGHYSTFVVTEKNQLYPGNLGGPWGDAWCGMLLNMWQPELVQSNYRRQIEDWLVAGPDGTTYVRLPESLMGGEPGVSGEFGWVAAWAAEMGDTDTVAGLLAHADRFMNPQWDRHGYFYPRNDRSVDADGNVTIVNPTTGNALLAYARLNVKDGLRALYERPWGSEHFAQPALTEMSDGVDVRRAIFLPAENRLVLTLQCAPDGPEQADILVDRLWSRGDWTLSIDGEAAAAGRDGAVEGSLQARRENDGLRLSLSLTAPRTLVFDWG